jgi:hypothetical protein
MKPGYVEKYETIIVPPESKVKLRVNRNLMNTYVDYSMKCDTAAPFMTCKRWPSNSDWQVVEASFQITWLSRCGRKTTAKSDC